MVTAFLICSPLLAVEAMIVSARNPSNLWLPVGVAVAANGVLLGPALRRRFGPRLLALAAFSSRARWSSWTATARRRHADSVR